MRILILHNAYRWLGGEDHVVANEAALLRSGGHDVHVELVHNSSIGTLPGKVRTLARLDHDPHRVAWMHDLLDRIQPEIVHIHNFFPLLTPAVHEAASSRSLPVIQTLHNYRALCAAGTFEREGRTCELCLSGSRLNAVRHRCYRNSAVASAALVRMQRRLFADDAFAAHVTTFIALTRFSRQKFIEGGIPADQLVVKPNFAPLHADRPPMGPRNGMVFVGRLSHEKGVKVLIDAWMALPDIPLTICGDGPMRGELEARAPGNVKFLGYVDKEEITAEMRRARAIVIPSISYEGFPLALVEAFETGLPAIVSRIGSLTEIVEAGKTGEYIVPNDASSLAETVRDLHARTDHLGRLGANARATFEEKYTPQQNLAQLQSIYRAALQRRRGV